MADTRVLLPQSLIDLLTILKKRPDCHLWAGGTWLGHSSLARSYIDNHDVISLGKIEELTRIFHTDRFTDIGACCTLERLLSLESSVVPLGLKSAILQTVPSPARSLATLGGNLCLPLERLSLLPWVAASDARLEIRRQGSQRLISAQRLLGEDGDLSLQPGEILCRIRLPLGRWNQQYYRRIPLDKDSPQPFAALAGFAFLQKDRLEDIRICIACSNRSYIIFTNPDSELAGARLPLSEKTLNWYLSDARDLLKARFLDLSESSINRLLLLITSYLESLPRLM